MCGVRVCMQRLLGEGMIVDETYPSLLRNQRLKRVIGAWVWVGGDKSGVLHHTEWVGSHKVG